FFQEEDGIRDFHVTGVQTCALPISLARLVPASVPLEWTEIGLSSADMELLNHSNASADDIYRGYHVPLFFRTLDSSTYNNVVTRSEERRVGEAWRCDGRDYPSTTTQ